MNQISQQEKQQSQIIQIENLPTNYNHLLLQELIKNVPGVSDYQWVADKAVVKFMSANDAKLALSGKND